MFHMSNDSGLFRTRDHLEAEGYTLDGNVFERGEDSYLPLYEAKMIHQYDHRWATYDPDGSIIEVPLTEKTSPDSSTTPRYWVDERHIRSGAAIDAGRGWFLGFRRIARSTDERTLIAGEYPLAAVGDSIFVLASFSNRLSCLNANLAALVLDFVTRQKLGGTNLNFFIVRQLAVLPPSLYKAATPWSRTIRLDDWIDDRVDELIWTSWDANRMAVALGDDGPPFVWSGERRALIRAELDAAFFHLYGLDRDEVEHVLGTFPIVRRKDEAKYGEYRTARLILEVYDAMAEAMRTGVPYQTVLDPPPGEGARHPDRERVA